MKSLLVVFRGGASGSQCSKGTILWSLRKSCDFLAKWQYWGSSCEDEWGEGGVLHFAYMLIIGPFFSRSCFCSMLGVTNSCLSVHED